MANRNIGALEPGDIHPDGRRLKRRELRKISQQSLEPQNSLNNQALQDQLETQTDDWDETTAEATCVSAAATPYFDEELEIIPADEYPDTEIPIPARQSLVQRFANSDSEFTSQAANTLRERLDLKIKEVTQAPHPGLDANTSIRNNIEDGDIENLGEANLAGGINPESKPAAASAPTVIKPAKTAAASSTNRDSQTLNREQKSPWWHYCLVVCGGFVLGMVVGTLIFL